MALTWENASTTEIPTGGKEPPNLEFYIAFCQAIIAVILCGTLWILISMTVYGRKMKKWKNSKGGRLYIAGFIAICLALARLIVHLVLFQIPNIPGALKNCEVIVDVTYCLSGTVVFSTYLFMWARQRAIYAHPVLKKINGKWIDVVSWIVFALLCVAYVIGIFSTTIPIYSSPSDAGCVYAPRRNTTDALGIWLRAYEYLLLAFMLFVQVSLLFLFLYPMVRNRFSGQRNGAPDRIMNTVRRSVIAASIAMVTDISVTILGDVLQSKGYPMAVVFTVYTADMFVYTICILATFKNFQSILTVFCGPKCGLDKSSDRGTEASENTDVAEV